MARINIEECLSHIPNRFELTLCATYRARQLLKDEAIPKEGHGNKACVVALSEISAGRVGREMLRKVPLR